MAEIGEVIIQKRRGAKNIRLTISHDGVPKITMPSWSPFKVGEAFAISRSAWIIEHQKGKGRHLFEPDTRVGKAHRIRYIYEKRSTITSRVTQTELIVRLPHGINTSDIAVQNVVHTGAIRALKQEAQNLLPARLELLAQKHGFEYKSVSVKRLKSRWGSCSSHKEIALNIYLMQLPWEIIDYVLMHELLHTRIMAHGKPFWDELSRYVPELASKRKVIRDHRPALIAQT